MKRRKNKRMTGTIAPENLAETMRKIDKKTAKKRKGKAQTTGAMTIIEIKEKEIQTLIDMGSFVTIMNATWAEYLDIEAEIDTKAIPPTQAITATGEKVGFKGLLKIEVTLNGNEYPWEIWVAENTHMPLIVGNDHLMKGGVDLKNRMWSYKRERIPITIMTKEFGGVQTVTATTGMTLPPLSAAWLRGEVVRNKKGKHRRTVEILGTRKGGRETSNGLTNTSDIQRE